MSRRHSKAPPTSSTPSGRALAAYLDFVVGHKEVYRIIDEAEFVDPEGFRRHYVTTAERIAARLRAARERGEISDPQSPIDDEVHAWAIMGMNVFLGLRFGVWGDEDPEAVAKIANRLLRDGLEPLAEIRRQPREPRRCRRHRDRGQGRCAARRRGHR